MSRVEALYDEIQRTNVFTHELYKQSKVPSMKSLRRSFRSTVIAPSERWNRAGGMSPMMKIFCNHSCEGAAA